MADLTPEQRAIVERIGALSRQFQEALRQHEIAQDEARQRDAAAAVFLQMTASMNAKRQRELAAIFARHVDAFTEFIDTL
jgi:chemotaxis regulatin CheY-phosphate phosphatase CheZ